MENINDIIQMRGGNPASCLNKYVKSNRDITEM